MKLAQAFNHFWKDTVEGASETVDDAVLSDRSERNAKNKKKKNSFADTRLYRGTNAKIVNFDEIIETSANNKTNNYYSITNNYYSIINNYYSITNNYDSITNNHYSITNYRICLTIILFCTNLAIHCSVSSVCLQ